MVLSLCFVFPATNFLLCLRLLVGCFNYAMFMVQRVAVFNHQLYWLENFLAGKALLEIEPRVRCVPLPVQALQVLL